MIARVRAWPRCSPRRANFSIDPLPFPFFSFPFFFLVNVTRNASERDDAWRERGRVKKKKKSNRNDDSYSSRLLLFDAQLCNTITPASRIIVPLLRSCETRESRGRARLPVTAPCYSIFSVYDFPLLFTLKFESISRSGGIVGKRRIVVQVENLDLFESGSRKLSYCNEVLTERREKRYEQSWEQLFTILYFLR